MLPHERIPYQPVAGRPSLGLPGGARVVVWVIVNVEEWDPPQPMPRPVLTLLQKRTRTARRALAAC